MIINCMQHSLSQEQILSLVEVTYGRRDSMSHLKDLNQDLFNRLSNTPSTVKECQLLVNEMIQFLSEYKELTHVIMPVGSPCFNALLWIQLGFTNFARAGYCDSLASQPLDGLTFLFSHSERESVEEAQPDGTVKKQSVFKHRHWLKITLPKW